MNPKFNPLPEGYEPPEVKLELFLKPYDRPPTPKTPVLTGYVRVTKAHLAALSSLLDTSPHINLRVALWDSKVGPGVEGVIEYREYNPPAQHQQEHSPSSPSHWY